MLLIIDTGSTLLTLNPAIVTQGLPMSQQSACIMDISNTLHISPLPAHNSNLWTFSQETFFFP